MHSCALFVDFKTAFDRIKRVRLWHCINQKDIKIKKNHKKVNCEKIDLIVLAEICKKVAEPIKLKVNMQKIKIMKITKEHEIIRIN